MINQKNKLSKRTILLTVAFLVFFIVTANLAIYLAIYLSQNSSTKHPNGQSGLKPGSSASSPNAIEVNNTNYLHPTQELKTDSTTSNSKSISNLKLRLSKKEYQIFINEISTTFSDLAIQKPNSDELKAALSNLNKRSLPGVMSILDDLSIPADNDKQVILRLFEVDYIKYRLRWDAETRSEVIDFLISAVSQDHIRVPPNKKAAFYGDIAEIMNALASTDWPTTSKILQSINDQKLKKIAANEAYFGLIQSGLTEWIAVENIKTVVSDFTKPI